MNKKGNFYPNNNHVFGPELFYYEVLTKNLKFLDRRYSISMTNLLSNTRKRMTRQLEGIDRPIVFLNTSTDFQYLAQDVLLLILH